MPASVRLRRRRGLVAAGSRVEVGRHHGPRDFDAPAVAEGTEYALHLALGWLVMFWALMRYDAFVFLCGKTLTNRRLELWLLRALGKPAVVIFIGSDARPAYISGAWLDSSPGALRRRVRRQKHKVRWLERLAAACVNAPGTAHFHEREVVNWFVCSGFHVSSLELRPRGIARL